MGVKGNLVNRIQYTTQQCQECLIFGLYRKKGRSRSDTGWSGKEAVFSLEKWQAGPYFGGKFLKVGELSRAKALALNYKGELRLLFLALASLIFFLFIGNNSVVQVFCTMVSQVNSSLSDKVMEVSEKINQVP